MTEPDEIPEEHELVMPFVIVTSAGGPFDDDAFVAGWTCAQVDETLLHSGAEWSGYVPEALMPQLDLLAMKHRKTLSRIDVDEASGRVLVRIGHGG